MNGCSGLAILTIACALFATANDASATQSQKKKALSVHDAFVKRDGQAFLLRGKPFRVAGVNNHYLAYGSKQEVTRVLDSAVAMHANVVRTFIQPIIGSVDGQMPTIWNWKSDADSSNLGVHGVFMASWDSASHSMIINDGKNGLGRIDFLIKEAAKRKLKLIIAFADFWSYTGGAQQMSAWYGGGKEKNNSEFFAKDARTRADYKRLVKAVLTRTNPLTHIAYKDDPTIFAWELMNEPDILPTPLLKAWITEMASYVKSIDPHHMLASGHSSLTTKLFELDVADIDFGTWHGYPAYEKITPLQFGEQIDEFCSIAASHQKPVILEEFGIARSDPSRAESYKNWLERIRDNKNCGGWVVWRLVARQDNNELPADHDQFDISNDGSPEWLILRDSGAELTGNRKEKVAPLMTSGKVISRCSKTQESCL